LLDGVLELVCSDTEKDLSKRWYLFGGGDTDEFLAIDLSRSRFGWCYFVNLYFFGQPNKTPIIAFSFSDFLEVLYRAGKIGEQWSWYNLGLGDAYVLAS
jgi:hypothetical protein